MIVIFDDDESSSSPAAPGAARRPVTCEVGSSRPSSWVRFANWFDRRRDDADPMPPLATPGADEPTTAAPTPRKKGLP